MEQPIEDNQKEETAANQREKDNDDGVAQDKTEAEGQSATGNGEDEAGQEEEDSTVEEEQKREGEGAMAVAISKQSKSVQMSIWVWVQVLAFISRMELANNVSLACHFLTRLCWPRLHGNKAIPYMVKQLQLKMGKEENGQTKAMLYIRKKLGQNSIEIPFATAAPPPDHIQGFVNISIRNRHPEVFRFIQNIRRPLLADLNITCYGFPTFHDLQNLLNALNGCSIARLDLVWTSISILELHQHFPGLLETIPAIHVRVNEDGMNKWHEVKALILAKLEGGKQFYFNVWQNGSSECSLLIDNIKKAFQAATQPHSFTIEFALIDGLLLDVFRLENDNTGEVLFLEDNEESSYSLYRCPRGEIQQWRWQEKFEYNGTDITLGPFPRSMMCAPLGWK